MTPTRRRVFIAALVMALLIMIGLVWIRPRRPTPPTPATKTLATERPMSQETVPQTPGPMNEPASQDPSELEISWKNLHPAMKFRSFIAHELPYLHYEERLIQLEGMTGSRIPKSHLDSVRFVADLDKRVWALVDGLEPAAQRKVLLDLASGAGTVPDGVDPTAARVRSLMLLWKVGRDEQIIPLMDNLAGADPDSDVRTGSAVLMAHWGEVDRVGRWLKEAPIAQAEDFLAPLAVGTNTQTLSIPEPIGKVGAEPKGSFNPDLANLILDKLGTAESRAIQARLIIFLKMAAENEQAAKYLLQQGNNADTSLRNVSLGSLGRALSSPNLEYALIEVLKDPDPWKARAVVGNFRYRLSEERRVSAILPFLQREVGAHDAIEILETAPYRHLHLIIPALQQAAATHADASIREKAGKMAETLVKRKPPPPLPPR